MVEGYKHTEVGVIPEDWETKKLGDFGNTFGGLSGKSKSDFEDGKFPYIPFMNIMTNPIIDETYFDYVNIKSGESQNTARKGDIFFNGSSETAKEVGMCSVLTKDIPNLYLNSFCFGFRLFKDIDVDCIYLVYFLRSNIGRDLVSSLAQGSTRINISKKQMLNLTFKIPKIEEQKAIAEVLCDTDELIHTFEKRISKKRNIKQGAMHKLLSQKEGWKTKKLGDFGNTFGGLSGKSKSDFEDGEFPYIPFMNIMTNPIIDETYFDYVNIKSGDHQNTARKGDLFFNGSSETPKEVGMCSVLNKDIPNLYLNSFCFGFRFFKNIEVHGLYLVYFLRSGEGRDLVSSLAQGSTRINISKKQLLKLSFKIPKIEEQKRIATILSDMDKELKKLEDKLDKYKDIKQGLMQQLLTGKIRLV